MHLSSTTATIVDAFLPHFAELRERASRTKQWFVVVVVAHSNFIQDPDGGTHYFLTFIMQRLLFNYAFYGLHDADVIWKFDGAIAAEKEPMEILMCDGAFGTTFCSLCTNIAPILCEMHLRWAHACLQSLYCMEPSIFYRHTFHSVTFHAAYAIPAALFQVQSWRQWNKYWGMYIESTTCCWMISSLLALHPERLSIGCARIWRIVCLRTNALHWCVSCRLVPLLCITNSICIWIVLLALSLWICRMSGESPSRVSLWREAWIESDSFREVEVVFNHGVFLGESPTTSLTRFLLHMAMGLSLDLVMSWTNCCRIFSQESCPIFELICVAKSYMELICVAKSHMALHLLVVLAISGMCLSFFAHRCEHRLSKCSHTNAWTLCCLTFVSSRLQHCTKRMALTKGGLITAGFSEQIARTQRCTN